MKSPISLRRVKSSLEKIGLKEYLNFTFYPRVNPTKLVIKVGGADREYPTLTSGEMASSTYVAIAKRLNVDPSIFWKP